MADVDSDRISADHSLAQETAERYRLAARATKDAIWDWHFASNYVLWNEALEHAYGHVLGSVDPTGEWWIDHIHPDDRSRVDVSIHSAIDGKAESWTEEYRFRRGDDTYASVLDRGHIIRDSTGRAVRMIGAMHDQTEQKASRLALQKSEARYRELFDSVKSGFCVVEVDLGGQGRPIDYRVIEANAAFYEQTGFPRSILGSWLREAAPGLEDYWFEIYGRVARTGEPQNFEHSAGMLGRWFDVYAFRSGEPGERRVAILFSDISGRRNAEEQLRRLNETLEAQVAARAAERDRLWNLSQDMLARADYTGMMTAVSPAWTQVLGWSEEDLLSRGYATFMHAEDVEPTLQAIARMGETRQPSRFENRIATADGGWKQIEWTVAPEADGFNFIAVGRDMSRVKARERELAQAQEQLRQSQKLEAMGQLTGGVAHDFNNLLTPIIGTLDLLLRRGIGSDRERRLIEGALQSSERAKTLVQRLLAFARRQPLQPVAVDVPALIDGMIGLIGSTLGPTIEIRIDAAEDVPPAKADPNQLEMALLNLAVNARDAMPGGGRITIDVTCEVEPPAGIPGGPGPYVCLRVTDNGDGMDQETLARAIEPFFSTKGIGRGTGLGLSMVHGLAAQLGGGLKIESQLGEGTTVMLFLPSTAHPAAKGRETLTSTSQASGRGRVLLVDDEALVRMSTADMLADLGLDVTEVGSAEEALQRLQPGAAFDLLVTDHLMSGMNGVELAYEARRREPDLPVLIVSGYAEVEGIAPDLPRLTKPFRNSELAEKVFGLITGDASLER